MHADIIRKDGKLELKNLSCDCSLSHVMPEMDIFIRSGLIDDCAACIESCGLGKNVLVVADSITLEVAARTVIKNLERAGFICRLCVLPGDEIDPTPEMADYISAMVEESTEFLLSVGSGVITDLTRRSAFLTKRPFAAFGTAASMDGYTSITSSMMISGMKLTLYGSAARLLMFDTRILAAAPQLMQASGVGDMLAKYNVLVDWKLGSVVAGEIYCPLCTDLVEMALARCSSAIDEILARTEAGMEALIEALILAGLTVLIIGNTRTVASVEHNMSHYWEMMALAYGGTSPSHGISVGIGLIYSLLYHGMLKNTDISKLDKEKIKASRMTKEQKQDFIVSHYPPGGGEEVIERNPDWYLEWPEQERRIDALVANHEAYKKDSEKLPDYRDIIRYMTQFGAPTSATKAGISMKTLKDTLLVTKNFRQRYNITTALDELGLLEEFTDRILAMEDTL